MIGYTQAPRAWWLTRGMARIAGVNLPRAVVDGALGRNELENLVTRCDQCPHSAKCDLWLARSGAETRLPDFCPNKTAIEALSPKPRPPEH